MLHIFYIAFTNSHFVLRVVVQQAMEEKYRLCDESLQKLLQWIAEVEDKLANQDVVHEQVDELRNQINNLKVGSLLLLTGLGPW